MELFNKEVRWVLPITLTAPSAMILPRFYENGEAVVYWNEGQGDAEGGVRYELDVVYDDTFENGTPVEILSDTQKYQYKCTRGLSWDNYHSRKTSWEEFEHGVRYWSDQDGGQWPDGSSNIQWKDVSAVGPMTWEEIESQIGAGFSWQLWESFQYTGAAFEALCHTWQDIHAMRNKITYTGRKFKVDANRHFLYLRVRMVDGQGNSSGYYITGCQTIINREEVPLKVDRGMEYYVQLNADIIESWEGGNYTLYYNLAYMELDNFAVQLVGENHISEACPLITNNQGGRVTFTCRRPVGTGNRWSGLVTKMNMKAQDSGHTMVRLEAQNLYA